MIYSKGVFDKQPRQGWGRRERGFMEDPKVFLIMLQNQNRSIKKHKILNLNEEFYLPFLFVACQ